eukprot:CAMPEP_0175246418 /NCGR_PEP_ID=MMETSP0093-20121207/33094_1 /TAXON_ID=311494 /ORGANISM="Alexandrium monilatum, Strain CCMP3105" /LENGTH=195 /DNA_ID=CAMNT_0016540565 /DNA_START=12 /DNA_END=599 /DNA_ORIENTATION=+
MAVVYLHGFGAHAPEQDVFATVLRTRIPDLRVRSYHPGGDWRATRLPAFLEALRAEAPLEAIVGYSVGGLIAALFQERHPELVRRVVLLAPAIDNFERNFRGRPPEEWHMPAGYVEELAALPARPAVRVPALLVHGQRDTDAGGGAPWRVREWAEAERFERVFFPDVGHGPDIVGRGSPGWDELAAWALTGELRA